MSQMTDLEMLKYAQEHGMIDVALVQQQIDMQKRMEVLQKHPYAIYQGNDGNWYTYLPGENGRLKRKRRTKEEVEQLVYEYWKELLQNPTVGDVFYEWVDNKLALKEISKATYDRYVVDFGRFFKGFGQQKIKTVTEFDVEEFLLEAIAEHTLTAKAFSNLRTLVFGIFKRAKRKRYVNFSITQVINDMEISKKSFKKITRQDYEEVFMEDELPKVVEYLKKNPDIINLGLLLAIVTGLRVGELVALEANDIYGNIIKVNKTETRYKDESGKTVFAIKETPKTEAGIREVIVPDDYLWVLKKIRHLNAFGQYLFMKDGVRIKTYTVRKRLYLVCKKTGVYQKSPHKIRKTYGSILLDNQVAHTLIIGQMGHTDIECTEKHYHRNRRAVEAKANVINSIPEFAAK